MENEFHPCPVCEKTFNSKELEMHVSNCIFLRIDGGSDASPKRKRENSTNQNASKLTKRTESGIKTIEDTAKLQSLSSNELNFDVPLAESVRPVLLDQFVGQEHVVGENSIIRKLLKSSKLPSLILWGPPGCGKTTLANVIKQQNRNDNIRFVKLSATMAGINDVKNIIEVAKNEMTFSKRRTVLFMDEIHRFNKLQQDIFLPHVENGSIILIGATTENPSFSLNNALLSRCRVITMEKLSSESLSKILERAVQKFGGIIVPDGASAKNKNQWNIESETIKWLSDISDGDARIALNSLQMAIQSKGSSVFQLSLENIKDGIKKSHLLYDKKGEEHYNIISALHKSIRASDDSAALYWLARMLESGEDPIFIARRLIRAASEDIGLADPNALTMAVATMTGCQQIGMPECDVLLAQMVTYLARSPKSTEVYHALGRAKQVVKNHRGIVPSVPLHLRNAPTKLMKDLGYGKNYNMSHKDSSGLTYMPDGLNGINFFDEQ